PWRSVGVGSVFETETVTDIEKPKIARSVLTTRQTVVARDAEGVTLEVETSLAGQPMPVSTVKIPFALPGSARGDLPKPETTSEDCAVPAGRFSCERTKLDVHQGSVARSSVTWMAREVPVAVKFMLSNE